MILICVVQWRATKTTKHRFALSDRGKPLMLSDAAAVAIIAAFTTAAATSDIAAASADSAVANGAAQM